jgi:hypothetical protein
MEEVVSRFGLTLRRESEPRTARIERIPPVGVDGAWNGRVA